MMTSVASSTASDPDPAQRLLDVGGALLLLILGAPILAVCALAIRLDSPGPVLFRQIRLGRGGRPFELLKLRTMAVDADAALHRAHVARLLPRAGSPEADRPGLRAAGQADRAGRWAKLDADPRVTRVGRLLRASALDELPQLLNVLRGEMSLVGPRPSLPYEADRWQEWHRARLAVRPGITGLWQVDGWGEVDFDGMVRQDLDYIRSRSLWLDLCLLARTPAALWRRARWCGRMRP